MQLSRDPDSYWYSNPEANEGWNTTKWATPFSGFRWAIPEYCDYSGRAIYMDADVVILSDLAQMWEHPIEEQAIVTARITADMARLCTCIWDCHKAQGTLPAVEKIKEDADGHQKMMNMLKENPQLVEPYQDSYNCVDGEDLLIEDIKILHYSDMGTQFSHKYSIMRLEQEGSKHWFDGKITTHPRKDLTQLFESYYKEAIEAGYNLDDYRVKEFGTFPKKNHKRYKGNKITRKSIFGRIFRK
jgi:hypothetical protein